MGKIKMLYNIIRSLLIFFGNEIRRGTLFANLKGLFKMDIQEEMSWGELLEEKAKKYKNRLFLTFENEKFSYMTMNENANRIANFFLSLGGKRSAGVALFMDNNPRFLDLFFGLQKIGMYSVPINTSLKGESLLYILNHCEAEYLVIDDTYVETVSRIRDRLENIKTIIVNPVSGSEPADKKFTDLNKAYQVSSDNPQVGYNKDDICFITYTSGTTGMPKGVVYRFSNSPVKLLSLVAHLLYKKSDVLYTAMKLFHGNALLVTVTCGMHVGARVVLAKKFSASSFWDEIREHNITSFNTIGAMIPILMKQPEKKDDKKNKVRFVLSAACPADLWEKFENRYGLTLYEAYGAVDGGGKTILNLGTAPVGSIGKPPMKIRYRLVDSEMNDVPEGESGELIFATSGGGGSVEYFRNEEASNEKSNSKWVFTGDLMKRDKKGYLYFIGRNTESMRIKGENVSAFEVEQILQKHPDVLEAAVYAVPSELAEDEIMASVSLVDGKSVMEKDIIEFVKADLPKFAVPKFVKIVDDFPKTETFRIKKNEIENLGIVSGTYNAETDIYVYL